MNDQELIAHLRAELKAMTELHDRKHRDWQEADNARQRLLVERASARADVQLMRPARTGESVWVACGMRSRGCGFPGRSRHEPDPFTESVHGPGMTVHKDRRVERHGSTPTGR